MLYITGERVFITQARRWSEDLKITNGFKKILGLFPSFFFFCRGMRISFGWVKEREDIFWGKIF